MDISQQQSKTPDETGSVPTDYVVMVCGYARGHGQVFFGKAKVVHVGIEDPPKLIGQLPYGEAKRAD